MIASVARDELAELSARFEVAGRVNESSSKRLFDAGLPGLNFFREFGPVYARYRGARFDFAADIGSRYDSQREIAFGKLRADAERLISACADMSEAGVDFRNSVNSIFAHWRGGAADSAQGRLSSFQSGATGVWTRLRAFADTLLVACDAAERIAFDRGNAVFRLAAEHAGGRTAKEVELLVDCALAGDDVTDRQIADLAQLCGIDVTPALCRTNPDVLGMVIDAARGWLDATFVPFYDLRMDVFDTVCTRGDADLELVWRGLSAVMDSVRANDFDMLAKQHMPLATVAPQAALSTESVATTANPTTGSVTQRLNPGVVTMPEPGPQASPSTPASPTQQPGLGPGVTAGAAMIEMGAMSVAPAKPGPVAPPTAAPTGGYGYVPIASYGAGRGDIEHQRKVALRGNAVEEAAATPTAIGAPDDPTAYNEAIRWEDDEPAPIAAVPVEPKPAEELVWQLGEDGELRQLKQPLQKEGKDD